MLITVNDVIDFLVHYDLPRFLNDRIVRRLIIQALIEIGDAANHVSTELKDRFPEVPEEDARSFRNFAIHQYFAVAWGIVWDTATVDVVGLRPQIANIVSAEFSGDKA